jgi:type VI secretion system protein ImpF
VLSGFDERNAMRGFTSGLFDRLDDTIEPPSGNRRDARVRAVEHALRSVTRDLQALLNTRCGVHQASFSPLPAVSGSILNYGLIDFAGMCMNSDTDQQEICKAVQLAIQRHEPRLHKC